MQGGQTKQGELFIARTHEDHKPIIFDRVLKAGNSVLLAGKMVIKNPEEVNAAIVNGKQSKEYFHRVRGHAGHHLMDATAKYYKVDLLKIPFLDSSRSPALRGSSTLLGYPDIFS